SRSGVVVSNAGPTYYPPGGFMVRHRQLSDSRGCCQAAVPTARLPFSVARRSLARSATALLLIFAAHDVLAHTAPRLDSSWCDPHLAQVLERDDPGIALALSGGGYRAMLFHAGALAKLNDAGLLPELRVVSSVSGGSITSAVLAAAWEGLRWENGRATNF